MNSSLNRRQTYRVLQEDSECIIQPVGRTAWMLDRLLAAGAAGCSTLETFAPRVSDYIHKLRTRYGLNIESVPEAHDGPFKGHHARYVLRSRVLRVLAPAAEPVRD